ncbi:HNH endonuclease signature motif containing protein [Mycobacterium sp. 236(2023)]|uniref:HNH endonuclease signature motif containing protein n=1 Tax=Mycobacterium sp. 236(2023) TaxID=3038163 RepID=UPI0024153167|nr:HNH endonuclease signature motif containing protein [Mycobacterium sp. 236(2023)]MDG4663215.1 DUF222 domain-containing protein [Mycobacterium sp. 236(2023)]
MFEGLADSASRVEMADAELDAAIAGWTDAISSASAHRMLLIAEKARRNYDDDCDSVEDTDAAWNSAAAEISLACRISHGRASGDMEVGLALTRLPRIAAAFLAGQITEFLVRRIVNRTANIQDADLLAKVEAEIAERAVRWDGLSQKKLDDAIDVWVDRHDPAALRHTRARVRDRGVTIGESKEGVTEINARLKGADAALYWRRLTVMAQGVCPNDPRTLDQRRADAHGAIGAGFFHLACECGAPDCPAAVDDGRGSHVVVHIYAENAALTARPDPLTDGEDPECRAKNKDVAKAGVTEGAAVGDCVPEDTEPERNHPETNNPGSSVTDDGDDAESGSAESGAAASTDGAGDKDGIAESDPAAAFLRPPPGVIVGFGHVPAEEIAARIRAGAKPKYLIQPGIDPQPRYRPSTALDEWVRARDLTCRFPHCDRPAAYADFDHTVPWPAGPTHPSSGKLLCRQHHLAKTFWAGWSDTQHPDGTVVWTTPTGRTYTTRPGSALLFPTISTTSAPIDTPAQEPTSADKINTMPSRRKRNRARTISYRIKAERALNDAYVAERNKPPPF